MDIYNLGEPENNNEARPKKEHKSFHYTEL